MTAPAGIAAQVAMTQQAVALEMLRQNAQMQAQIASILQEAVASVPVSAVRGGALNISA